jgi:serine/threonine-protein kinase
VEEIQKSLEKFSSLNLIEFISKMLERSSFKSSSKESTQESEKKNPFNKNFLNSNPFNRNYVSTDSGNISNEKEFEIKPKLSVPSSFPMMQIFREQEKIRIKQVVQQKQKLLKSYLFPEKLKNDSLAVDIERESNYYPISKLGEGAFASVYLCESKFIENKTMYALKVIGYKQDKKLRDKEIKANTKLNQSKYVAKMFEYFKIDDNFVIVLEYCEKLTLKDLISEKDYRNGLPEISVYLLFSQIVKGVEEIHNSGIIHRDLKPANIGLAYKYEIKIFDFTTAKFNDELDITLACGSPNYMDPEYLFSRVKIPIQNWEKLDCFSLGIILYYLAFGKNPYLLSSNTNLSEMSKLMKEINWELDDGKMINPLLKNLIENLIVIDNEKRFDLFKIKTHEWIKKCSDKMKEIIKQSPMLETSNKLFEIVTKRKITLEK